MMTSLLLAIGGGSAVAQTWEDYTSKITNPSFEADEAKGDLNSGWNSTKGWTITPSSAPKTSQLGIANANTKIQGIGTTFKPSAGDKFFYLRCNWQKATEFKVSQTISNTKNLPVGTYKLTCKVANFSSAPSATNYRLSLGDGTNTATNKFSYNEKKWGEWSIIFYKSDASKDLTIEAYMKPGAEASNQHYSMLLDDFKLEYLSDDELAKASSENPLGLTAAISNSTIYNPTQTSLPKGWSENRKAAGNNNRTEKTGDSQLEGWSGDNLNVKYYQTLTNLPTGKYVLKAKVHDSNEKGAVLYATSGTDKQTVKMGKDYAVLATPVVSVINGNLEIGIDAPNLGGTWMTGDDFTLSYVGLDLSALETAFSSKKAEAEALLGNADYKNITGDEKTELESAKNQNPAETKSALEAAINKLESAISAFTSAQPKYQALVDAKTLVQEELAYASKDKYTEFTTSKEATATSAADAETKANAIIAARRAYVESNGMAEGVKGAVDCTSNLQVTVAGENMPGVSYAELSINSGQGATDSEGNMTNKYYDTNGTFWGSDNLKAQMTQNASGLKSGKYLLTVAARGEASLNNLTLTAGSNSINLPIQTPNNIFGNNWDDYSIETIVDNSGNLNIKIEGKTTKSHAWFSFNNFRLFRLGDLDAVTLDEAADNVIEAKEAANVTLKRKFVANKWNTLVLPFAVSDADVKTTFGADAKIVEYSNADDANINFTTSTKGIKANVPVLIMPAAVNAENTYTFNSVSIVVADPNPKADGTNYSFVGSYKSYNLVNDDYMLYADKWWKTETGDTYKIKAFRAYIKANTPAAAKQLNLVIDGQTTGLKLNTVNGNIEGETYNIAGQRVANSYKGLVIKNGKKIIKK